MWSLVLVTHVQYKMNSRRASSMQHKDVYKKINKTINRRDAQGPLENVLEDARRAVFRDRG